ncbi:MAG: GNAT family N-acetyltransferase [Actinomycetota bacterium]
MRDASFSSIETARLRLRRFAPADIAAFHAYRADDDVARFQSWQDYTIEQAERFVEEMARHDPGVPGEPFQFAVARRDDDVLVGDYMLALDAGAGPNAEIGYTVASDHRGHGYSIEAGLAVLGYAFDHQGVTALRTVTDTRNAASIAIAERLGMQLIGTVHTMFKQEACDEHTYELTRIRWESRRA